MARPYSAGTFTLQEAPSFAWRTNANGSAIVTVQLRDSGGTANGGVDASAAQTFTITVTPVNDAPLADDKSVLTDEDTAKVITLRASDIDSASLGLSVVAGPGHGTLSAISALSCIPSGAGSVCTGTVTYTADSNYNGPDSFTYKANDGALDANVATVTITVNPVNDAPFFDPIANQTVAEDGGLRTVAITGVSPGSANEAEQTVALTAVSSNPVIVPNPTVSPVVAGSATLSYQPAADFNGSVTITVTANDGQPVNNTFSRTFTITVTEVNDPPLTVADSKTAAEDTALAILATDLTANDSRGTNEGGQTLTVTAVGSPSAAGGTVSLSAGSVTYTPKANFFGQDSFTYTVCDNGSPSLCATGTVNVTVNPVNDMPVAADDSYSTDEDNSLTVAAPGVLANDSDVDGDRLTAVLVTGPTKGTLTLNPDGSFTYLPNANFNGSDSFTYKANDGTADSNIATMTITVNTVNDAPVVNNQGVATPEDTPLLITLTGSDTDGDSLEFQVAVAPSHGTLSGITVTGPTNAEVTYTPGPNLYGSDSFNFIVNDGTANSPEGTIAITVSPVNDGPKANDQTVTTDEDTQVTITLTGSDPENDPLTFNLDTPPTHGVLSGTPPNLIYTPNPNFNGADSFTFTVSDGNFVSAPAMVAITVNAVNDTPTATSFSASTVENTPVTLTLVGNDPESDPLAFAIVAGSGPSNGSLGPLVGNSVTYTPDPGFAGLDSFSFIASDGSSTSAPATVTITVSSGEYKCPLTQGYWKTHPEAWLATFLTLGSQSYTKAELLTILNTPVKADASLILAHQLIAAKLNIASGSDPAPINNTTTHADGLLSGFSGKLPYNVKTSTTSRHTSVIFLQER